MRTSTHLPIKQTSSSGMRWYKTHLNLPPSYGHFLLNCPLCWDHWLFSAKSWIIARSFPSQCKKFFESVQKIFWSLQKILRAGAKFFKWVQVSSSRFKKFFKFFESLQKIQWVSAKHLQVGQKTLRVRKDVQVSVKTTLVRIKSGASGTQT